MNNETQENMEEDKIIIETNESKESKENLY